jgi:phosphoribosylformylglycinamidine synthase PurS subunit
MESAFDVEAGNSGSAREVIEHALDSLGFKNAGNVRVGKYMEVDVNETDKAKADAAVKAMCKSCWRIRSSRNTGTNSVSAE